MRTVLPWLLPLLVAGCGDDAGHAQPHAPPTPTTPSPAPTAPSLAPPRAEPSAEAEGPRAEVKLVGLGEFPDELADEVEQGLRSELGVEVERLDRSALPEYAYYAPRRRYRAERLLHFLNRRLEGEPASVRVLGLTAVDISTTKPPHPDWGIFGLGELGGRSCIISTFRLRRRARDAAHVRFRVVTTAVHEVGHTLGLDHCTEPRCVMRDAEGSIETVDTSTGRLGPACRAKLDRQAPRADGRP